MDTWEQMLSARERAGLAPALCLHNNRICADMIVVGLRMDSTNVRQARISTLDVSVTGPGEGNICALSLTNEAPEIPLFRRHNVSKLWHGGKPVLEFVSSYRSDDEYRNK